jgi:uncharacterized protein
MNSIDVFRMARSGASLDGELDLARMPRLAASLMRHDGRLAFGCQGRIDSRGRPAMQLTLRARLPLCCDRCARELDFALSVQRTFYFVASEAELAAIEIDDAPEEALLGSAHFDLAGLIEDEAILQLPISPRHDGCALLEEAAALGAPRPANPFAQLQGLREELRSRAAPGALPGEAVAGSGPTRPKIRRNSA